MSEQISCPVCRGSHFTATPTKGDSNRTEIKCAACGHFLIGNMAVLRLASEAHPDHRLSAWIRWRELRGAGRPEILQENLEDIRKGLPTFTVSDRTLELLKALAMLTDKPGASHKGSLHVDFSLAHGADGEELGFHLGALKSRGLIEYEVLDVDNNYEATLSPTGWNEVERGAASVLERAFVAMSFSDAMRAAWSDGFKPGIELSGYAAHRVDSVSHVDRIDQKIVGDIRTSRFVVADVTEQRPGVYFEAGLALGFGKTVVWSVRKDELPKVHFDTRQFAHIVWEAPEELRTRLRDVIVGVLGPGPRSPA